MRRTLPLMIAAVMSAAVTTGVSAQTINDQNRADAICLLAIADRVDRPAADEPPIDEQGMQILAGYFAGRIEGRSPSLALDDLITADLLRFVQANRATEYGRCMDEAQSIVEVMGKLATISHGESPDGN
ncbi:MAG: hypothetical protein HEQ22_11025 [Sphingopyxis sp.]|uniref:hypothetical protein n=1 Tax=Sphingopyxis sp. TaxID=1908224 RepID=UPI003D80C65B